MDEKILVVEDEPRVIRLISEVLKAVGYRVATAATGESAIETLALEGTQSRLPTITLSFRERRYFS